MPFSFTQIEQEKTSTIHVSVAFLLLFYFFSALIIVYACSAYFYFSSSDVLLRGASWPTLSWTTIGWTFIGAMGVGFIHWQYSQNALIDSVVQMMSGRIADPQVDEERIFRNVVEEATVATGGKYRIEPYIIPTAAMNAFALQDFQGRCVIGVTEGLLKRLNREQLEAVIGHEAGHIASGDCVETTTTSALFKTFDNICDISLRLLTSSTRIGFMGVALGDRDRRRGNDGRLVLFFLFLFILASILRLIGVLGAMFISRQREYRADAISARLTRNPLALAEALHIIDTRWKGGGMPGETMEAIFISNPRRSALEGGENFIADLFTTHPPTEKRIAVLLDMAHASEKDLDAALAKAGTRYDTLYAKPPEAQAQWIARKDGQWLGPFDLEQMKAQGWILPGTPVKMMGQTSISEARLDPLIAPLVTASAVGTVVQKDQCPRCHCPLGLELYEGVGVLTCTLCGGYLIKELDVLQIVHTREKEFDARIADMGQLIRRQARVLKQNPFDAVFDEKSIVCPSCLDDEKHMHRRFVSPQFPVEVDKCPSCARVWFDKDEIEVLQYLYEQDHPDGAPA